MATPERQVRRWVPLAVQGVLLAGTLYGLSLIATWPWALFVGCGTALMIAILNDLGRPLPEPAPRARRRRSPLDGD